jgi:hypothetical protein
MGVLQDILKKPDQGEDGLELSGQPFPELDLDRIAKDMYLAEEGWTRGEKNLPPATSTTLDDVEHKIVSAIENERQTQLQSFTRRLNAYRQRIASLDLENETIHIVSTAQRASTDFVVKVDEGKAKLFTLWRNVCMIENQWNTFRKQHNLTHPADYPLSRLWNFAVILVILAVESILNGNFLARGLETGLIGGIIQAFVIAAVNVFFGVFLGNYVARYIFHRNFFLRAIAFLEVPVSFGIAMAFNLFVGHYRDALGGADPMHASEIALNSFADQPLYLASLQSWILFAMGVLFFTIAAFDGFKMDDSYPGYGKISRKHEEITHDYANEKANIVDDLSRTRDQALDSIREARRNLATRRAELANMLDHQEKLVHFFDAYQNHLNRAANNLLSVYRSANMKARSAPAPGYFNDSYSLPKVPFPVSFGGPMNVAHVDANIEKTDGALKNAVEQVNARFEEAVGAFHQIEELTNGNGNATASAS